MWKHPHAPFSCLPEWLDSSSAFHQFLFIPLILRLPPRCFIFQVTYVLQEIITPFIWSLFLSFLEVLFSFLWFRVLLTLITSGTGVRKQLLRLTQHHRCQTQGPAEYQGRHRREVSELVAGSPGKMCVAPGMCKAESCATAARSKRRFKGWQLRNSIILTLGECLNYQ